MSTHGQFSSRIGFILAAAGSAIGLGNIWGFPTQAATHGGAAFLIIYLLLVFALAYPMLVAEIIVGRYGQGDPIKSIRALLPKNKFVGTLLGTGGLLTASGILSFYAILAGWLVAYFFAPVFNMLGMENVAVWLQEFGIARNIIFMILFMLLTILVVKSGVSDGIERWSVRLMPLLLILFVVLIAYILIQDGASEGLKMYLIPDWSHITPSLMVSAMGQAFFSLSLGSCSIMVYGSYLRKDANIPKTGAQVALLDTGVAFMAGLLILPAMFVAQKNGVQIYDDAGALISSGSLVFDVLPEMFKTMGVMGSFVAIIFFFLMIIAALTSSISMLEIPVSTAIHQYNHEREKSSWVIGLLITVFSAVIICNFDTLFGLVITITTQYGQPLLSMSYALILGWIWSRKSLLEEIKQGYPDVDRSIFWKIWPWYLRVVCPVLMLMVFVSSL